MRVVILADRSFARREHAMLARLEVGLADEGVYAVHAVPEARDRDESAADFGEPERTHGLGLGPDANDDPEASGLFGLYSTPVTYADRGLALTRRWRASTLLAAIGESTPEHLEQGIDIVHVFGTEAWAIGAELARASGAGLLLEVWKAAAVAQSVMPGTLGVVTKAGRATGSRAVVCGEPAIAEAVRKRSGKTPVHMAPWGVHAATSLRTPFESGRPLAFAVLADSGDLNAATAVLTGIAEACTSRGIGSSDVLVFLGTEEASVSRESALWQTAQRLGFRDKLTLLEDMEGRREPILQMDALLIAEAGGRQRTLALEAMAIGMPVLAVADPFVDSLIDSTTAKIIESPTSGAWAKGLSAFLADREGRAKLANSAHGYIKTKRTAAAQVAAVLKAYEAVRPTLSADGQTAV